MNTIAACLLAASLAAIPATGPAFAKTVTSSQGNADAKSAAGVAGTTAAAQNSGDRQIGDTKQPSKKVLKKSQVKAPPPLHDPN